MEIVKGILLNLSLDEIQKILIDDYGCTGIDRKTVSMMRHKITHTMAMYPMPLLSGVVQINETFFRENQKGRHNKSDNLISYIKDEKRRPRYGRQASKYKFKGRLQHHDVARLP